MPTRPPARDSGYSWVILAASTSLCTIFGSSFSTIGVYLVEFVEHFQVNKTELVWVGACQLSLFGFSGLFVGKIIDAVGIRVASALGAVLLGIGYLSSAFTDSLHMLYLTFGITAGIGYGIIFTTAPVPLQHYFDKRRATANGIMMAGNGLGAFLWPPLVEMLIQMFSWRGAMLLHGGLLLNGLVATALLKPFPAQGATISNGYHGSVEKQDMEKTDLEESASQRSTNQGCSVHCRSFVVLSLLKNVPFLLYWIGVFASLLGHFGVFAFLPLRVVSLGISKQEAAVLLSVLGACSGIGRVGVGILADKISSKRPLLAGVTAITTGLLTAGSLLLSRYWWLMLYVILYAFIGACYLALLATLVVDTLGLTHVAHGMGLCVAAIGLANLVLYPCTGALLDATGNASLPFLVFGGFQILGGTLFCAVQYSLSKRRGKQWR